MRLGAIRLHCQLRHTRDRLAYVREGRRLAERSLREQLKPVSSYQALIGTAGTVRAIVRLVGKETFTAEDLHSLLQREIHDPRWADLAPHRRKVLLSGLLIVQSLFTTLDLSHITYKPASAKRGLIRFDFLSTVACGE